MDLNLFFINVEREKKIGNAFTSLLVASSKKPIMMGSALLSAKNVLNSSLFEIGINGIRVGALPPPPPPPPPYPFDNDKIHKRENKL